MVNLKEYLYPEMDILFLALNAPKVSNENAHWFSRNLSFWNLLYDAGLITSKIDEAKKGDETVFGGTSINLHNLVIGVTDLNNEVVETDSNKVTVEKKHLKRIIKILETNKVKKVCMIHSKVGDAFRKSNFIENLNKNRYGKIGNIGKTEIYEVPFHNASIPNKEQYYKLLIDAIKPSQENNSKQETNKVAPKSKTRKYFIIPSNGNSITQNDIKKKTLRITVDFKDYFPAIDSIVEIQIGDKKFHAKYTYKVGRSSLLRLDEEIIQLLNLKPNQRLKFEMFDNNIYELSRI
ncbi:hypothetical protein [Chishuiella sp.]|uniref:hypothetical protein n=1 Tax=Chishuiella sp. TaxID=1969467 RepID=UPI0028A70861|nr:hypothetical protein [Chishuiella sp.]